MELIIIKNIIFLCVLAVISVQTRQIRRVQDGDLDHTGDHGFVLLVGGVGNARKSVKENTLARARLLFNSLTKKSLRQNYDMPPEQPEADTRNDDASLVEHELEDALAKKSSALQEKPYVQHKGKNDFLVFKSGVSDPFVTVIPNDIYYNVEKRCVNWLDDCNERGLRARLLQRVQSPYR